MYNILTISENPETFNDLARLLKKDFFSIYHSSSTDIEQLFDDLKQYDFILLHLVNDNELNARQIAFIKQHCLCPLYVFSSGHTPDEISKFLEIGSEGHIETPYNANEVAPRIKAVLRFLHQIKRTKPNTLRYGRLIVHLENREIYIDNKQIQLTNVEFKILTLLVENRDLVVSKDKIIHHVWDQDTSATDNALGIHITRLRKKLGCSDEFDLIETVWGLGYRINLSLCENSKSI